LSTNPARGKADKNKLAEIALIVDSKAKVAERTDVPGVATGLAWTPSGGDLLFIEATRMKGKGSMVLTGQLGDVMKESAQAALSYARSKAKELDLDFASFFIATPYPGTRLYELATNEGYLPRSPTGAASRCSARPWT
jgi:ATP-dependent Lon protease